MGEADDRPAEYTHQSGFRGFHSGRGAGWPNLVLAIRVLVWRHGSRLKLPSFVSLRLAVVGTYGDDDMM